MRRPGLRLCLLAAALPVGPVWAEAPPAGAARVRADVARLASVEWKGRRAGTPEADAAAAWIAERMKEAGLKPGAADEGWLQKFSFIDGVTLGDDNALRITGHGEPSVLRAGEDFRPLAFSAAGKAMGEVVFVGYGISSKDLGYDDYAGIDVQGKIVLVLRYGPEGDAPHSRWAPFMALRYKAQTAREHGASAVLVVTGPATKDAPDELVPHSTDASLADAGLPAFSVRRAVAERLFSGSADTIQVLQEKIDHKAAPLPRALPGVRVELRADVTPKRAQSQNVVGRWPGTSDETVVIGAHYDHLGLGGPGSLASSPEAQPHPGADDNASGVAGLLELARRFASRPEPHRRGLLFVAFGAEELGTLGSSQFVKNPPVPLDRVVAMLNMDMIGRMKDDTLEVHGLGTSPAWKGIVEEANRTAKLNLKLRDGGYGPSDHAPFYGAGLPVFFVFTGVHADYHRPSDTADKIEAEGLLRVLDLVEGVATPVLDAGPRIAFTRVPADKEQAPGASRGFRVWVGGVPDYSEEAVGVRFSGVTPGSPAEKAGLRGGDVLRRFGPKEIRNIYDYTYALGERKPGEVVTLVVEREGQDISLELTLGSRPNAAR